MLVCQIMKGNRLNISLGRGENSSEVTIDYIINRRILLDCIACLL